MAYWNSGEYCAARHLAKRSEWSSDASRYCAQRSASVHVFLCAQSGLLCADLPPKCLYSFLILPQHCKCTICLITPWFGDRNNICWRVQTVKLFVLKFSPFFVAWSKFFSLAHYSQMPWICHCLTDFMYDMSLFYLLPLLRWLAWRWLE